MTWTGFVPPTAAAAASVPTPKIPPPPPAKKKPTTNTGAEYIDVDLAEAVLRDNNGVELRWLRELLESGFRIKGKSGRYIKSDRFLAQLNKKEGEAC